MRDAVTLREIADALGVTRMTVSRALNGSPHLTPETRERILAKAHELGYRANSMARRINEGQYRGMALIGSQARPEYNIFEQPFHLAIGATLAERSWHLTQGWLPADGLEDPAVVKSLLDRMLADAVVLHDVGIQTRNAEEIMARHHIPTVWANSGRTRNGIDFADADGTALAVRHLLEQGYRRPALMIGIEPDAGDHISTRERARGFAAGCAQAGIPAWLLHPPTRIPYREMLEPFRKLFAAPERPDAVVCYNEELTILVRIIAAEHGWRIGPDLGVVTILASGKTLIDQPYTTLELDYHALGVAAVQMAWRILETGNQQPQVQIPVALIRPGASTNRNG